MGTEIIHIAGRYNKYLRNLSQSPWIDKDDVRIKHSVQELLEDGLKKFLTYDKAIFSSSGREDVDVRMLGKGRPFVFKVHDPLNISDYNRETLSKIQDYVNQRHAGKVAIRDLQIVSKSSVSKHLLDGQESKTKEYRALCCCTRKLSASDVERINAINDLTIEQKTPIRVLHRRTFAVRRRKIPRLRIEPVKCADFDSAKEEDLDNLFALTLVTEAGTYVKEFVHSDFGRTVPNLASLLGGDCETDLLELDVMEVFLDWPPSLEMTPQDQTCPVPQQTDNMDKTDQALSELYRDAVQAMRDAELLQRGDKRQETYLKSRKLFEKTMELVESLALFSDNETLDDVSTTNLKYLLIPAYLGKILISAEVGPNRLDTFVRAEEWMYKYLQMVSNYGIESEKVNKILSASKSSTLAEPVGRKTGLEEAMQNRNEKIEKYKRMKELESRIEELERRLKSGQEVDDETERELYTKMLIKWIEDTSDSLLFEVKPAIFFEQNRSKDILNELPSGPKYCPPKNNGQVENSTFTIVQNEMQKQVFGLGYPSRPTVTVDQFITQKMNSGELAFQTQKEIYSNSLQRYAEQPNLRRDQEEQSDEEREAKEERDDAEELTRKRNWDEFKDDTPRGSGNRHNMG